MALQFTEREFIPVLLGGDINAYSVARAFYEEYQVCLLYTSINRKIIDAAVEKLPAGLTTGQLVSNLTLGFWVHLADRSREAAIWRTALYRAWPRGTRRKELLRALDGVLRVRNRVAHDERLFDPRRPEPVSYTRLPGGLLTS